MLTTKKSLEACQMMVSCLVLVPYLCPFMSSLVCHFLIHHIFSCADYFYQNWVNTFM